MFPNPIMLGPLALNYYGIMVALGLLAGLILFSFTASRRGIPPSTARDFSFWMILAGLLGSRFFYVLFHWPEFSGNLAGVFAYWRGGLMFQGGVIAALLISPGFLKRYNLNFWPTADVLAPSLALGQCFGRLGCFSAGCCYGQATGVANPLAVTFPEGSLAPAHLPLLPVQLFESFGLLVLAIILVAAIRSASLYMAAPGRIAALYLLGAGLLRLGMEFLRGDYRGDPLLWGLPPTTLVAAAAAIVGLILLLKKRPDLELTANREPRI